MSHKLRIDEPMNPQIEGEIAALKYQRNEALDRCAVMNGTIAALKVELDALKALSKKKNKPVAQPA